MKIDHAALYVTDLEGAKAFFETYLGALSNQGYYNPNTRFRSYFLSFDDGCRLELMTRPELPLDHGRRTLPAKRAGRFRVPPGMFLMTLCNRFPRLNAVVFLRYGCSGAAVF